MKIEKNVEETRPISAFEDSSHNQGAAAPKKKVKIIVLVLVAVLVVLCLGWYFLGSKVPSFKKEFGQGNSFQIASNSGSSSDNLKFDQGKYQAVFLNNGEVYFGKIRSHEGNFLELTDIYYIQVTPVLQQGQDNKNNEENKPENQQQQQQQNQISIVKLGGEMHGPADRMMINKNIVSYVEDIKDDSKVTQAINQYLNKK